MDLNLVLRCGDGRMADRRSRGTVVADPLCANVKHLMFQFYGFGSCGQTLLFIVFVHNSTRHIWPFAVRTCDCMPSTKYFRMFVICTFASIRLKVKFSFKHFHRPSPRIALTFSRVTSFISISERWINGPVNLLFLFSHFLFEYWDDVNCRGHLVPRLRSWKRKHFLHQFHHFPFRLRCHSPESEIQSRCTDVGLLGAYHPSSSHQNSRTLL